MSKRITVAEYERLTAKQKSRVTPETQLKRVCTQYLQFQGWLVKPWFQQGMVPKNVQGMPDKLAIKNGRVVFLEFKVPGKNLSPTQAERKAELESYGAEVYVIRSVEDLYALGDEEQMVIGRERE